MHFTFIHPFKLMLSNEHTQESGATVHQSKHDESEGAEFLDDAVRHEALPVTYSIDHVAEE
jgi:hypothetical protein